MEMSDPCCSPENYAILYADVKPMDNLDFDANKFIIELLRKNHEKLYFTCKVHKYNKWGLSQERVMMITDKSLYSLSEKTGMFSNHY